MNYKSSKPAPYVYMCIHKETKNFYIGYREANVKLKRTSDVDFPLYKSSSIKVKHNFLEFDWIILAEFQDGESAYDFEQLLIFENWNNHLLLNEHCCHNGSKFRRSSPPWNKGRTGVYTRTESTKEKIRIKRAQQVMPESPFKGKTYDDLYGNRADELRDKISKRMLNANIQRSEEFKEKLRKPKQLVECPHCGKVGGGGSMRQWHFDRCKQKK